MTEQERQLWGAFRAAAADPAARLRARNALAERHGQLLRSVAAAVHRHIQGRVELDDLVSAGVFGLFAAIERFDPARGIRFATYASPRIRGSILDSIRDMDWAPRLTRQRNGQLEDVAERFAATTGRRPTREELAQRLGLSPNATAKVLEEAIVLNQVSLSRKWYETDSQKDVREIDMIADRRVPDPAALAGGEDAWDHLLRGLEASERLIITLYYRQDLTMKEIGQALGLSESRVSQMHTLLLPRLKARLTRPGRKESLS